MTESRFTDMPERIRKLPVDARGYPIPWFVETLPDGTRDFRIASSTRRRQAVKLELCWVCGERLGVHKVFVIGPMCCINRITSEPPCHMDCAEFAAKACPFLTRPMANYRKTNLPESIDPNELTQSGLAIDRNPGVTCLWTTSKFSLVQVDNGWLIRIGEPTRMSFWREGRAATEPEVRASIMSGLPFLEEEAKRQDGFEGGRAMDVLSQYVDRFEKTWLGLRRAA